ncbi:MAG: hypothetical protein KDI71_23025 [Xanthomonadales bacterium]|nr:hypothetical protein [Xanthomonadales bacterium]
MNSNENNEVRILGRVVARELTEAEIVAVAGGDTMCDNGHACVFDDCEIVR